MNASEVRDVCDALREALTRRYGQRHEYQGMEFWDIRLPDGGAGEGYARAYVHATDDDCALWLANAYRPAAPARVAWVRSPADVPGALAALDRFLRDNPAEAAV